ncbi:MAG: SCO family protein [Candidatus Neomarinimicrobiota bacterium]|nr:SCO family protein [Candidatus Neomarinimicrobiota bacterium]
MKKINRIFLLLFLLNYLYPQTLKKEFPGEGPIDIIERLGNTVALDSEFLNEKGEKVVLKDFFYQDIPTIITLNYFECPMLCSLVLNGLGDSIKKMNLNPGDEYQIITIDINPHESYKLANQKKNNYIKQYDIENLDKNWTFLTGNYDNIKKVTDSIGFIYYYDRIRDEYMHPAALTVVSSEGMISRYLYGIQFPEKDLKLALLEAAKGKIGSTIDKIILSCYRYDPYKNTYTLFATNIMRIGGIFTLIFIGLMLYNYWRKDHYLIGD